MDGFAEAVDFVDFPLVADESMRPPALISLIHDNIAK
jgi:hypothetical protein